MLEWPKSKTLPTPNAGKDVEQRELLFVAGGNAKWHSHVGDSVVVSYKTEHAPYSLTPWYLLKGAKKLEPHKNLHMDVDICFSHSCPNLEVTVMSSSR